MKTLRVGSLDLRITLENNALVKVDLPRQVPSNLDAKTLRKAFDELGRYKLGFGQSTEFTRQVWKKMREIPRGRTLTYGEIAKAIGRPKAFRAVGAAVGSNPLMLINPCHRVVAKNGLGGFRYGLAWKRKLLELELN